MSDTEFVALPTTGRRYCVQRRVHLSDTGPDAVLRPDGFARYLQDVANDDWDDTGVDWEDTWVVRRTVLRVGEGGRWPTLGEQLTVTTWCSGVGAAWAERRTDLHIGATLMIEAAGLWVPLDDTGFPRRLRPSFFDVYGTAVAQRKISSRVPEASIESGAQFRPWPLRRADLDIVGHVNNAAIWSALSEVARGNIASASVTHHGALEGTDQVTLATTPGRLWLVVNDEVRVSGEFEVR